MISDMPKDIDNCPYQPHPKIIETLKHLNMIQIACGKAHSLSIDSNGCLFTWRAGHADNSGLKAFIINLLMMMIILIN